MKNVTRIFCSGMALAAVAAMPAVSASGEVIVQYATAGSVTSISPIIANANVAADDLTAGPGLNVQTFSTFNFTGWDTASTDFDAAVAAGDFWSWGFEVTGNDIILETLDTRLDRSGSGPDDVEIQASINGGTGVTVFTFDYADSGAGVNFPGIDISALGTVTLGDTVVFTLAAFNSESDAGSFDLETLTFPGGTDSLVVNGTVVPEPASLVLLGLGGVAMLTRRRSQA